MISGVTQCSVCYEEKECVPCLEGHSHCCQTCVSEWIKVGGNSCPSCGFKYETVTSVQFSPSTPSGIDHRLPYEIFSLVTFIISLCLPSLEMLKSSHKRIPFPFYPSLWVVSLLIHVPLIRREGVIPFLMWLSLASSSATSYLNFRHVRIDAKINPIFLILCTFSVISYITVLGVQLGRVL
jgi:hypothetical protein